MLENLRRRIANAILPIKNKFNEAFLIDGGYAPYDLNQATYVNKGYRINPLVYKVVNEMATKTAAVPFYVRKIEDKQAKSKLDRLMVSTKGDLSMMQFLNYIKLRTKAFNDDEKPFPMDRPNPNQTWPEFIALYKTFIRTTGNAYLYTLSPKDGMNAGQPTQIYLLPSHLVQIIVKDKTNLLTDENPIKCYIMIYGRQFIEFEVEDVIHIKYSNPHYDENGAHLYGQSPLQAALKSIQSSNQGFDLNIKTLKSGGAFGLIHGKGQTLTPNQAANIKERLLEMDSSPDRLAKIAGVSAEVGFTRLSLTSHELQPFEYLKWDEKQIADCLNWEVLDESRGDFGGTIKEVKKQRVVDNIEPDLKLLQDALNNEFIKRFKGYEDCEIVFDIMELPEMQSDVKEITEWLNNALDRGVINRNEYRAAIRYVMIEDDAMNQYTVSSDIISLEEAITNDFRIDGTP